VKVPLMGFSICFANQSNKSENFKTNTFDHKLTNFFRYFAI
jgi:hypothetical protein